MPTASSAYIYADNAATTPLSPFALEAMMPYLTSEFGNPSGIHRIARDAARALDQARTSIAGLLGAPSPREVFFTSGGSESDNWILRGAVQLHRDLYGDTTPVRIITSAIEHHAVLHCCDALARQGVEITLLPVDKQGFISPQTLDDELSKNPKAVALVSIMLANNEIGTIQDIQELARVAHAHGALFHTDAVQAVGHIPVDVAELGVDALSLSAHKFHGPRGVGALYLREGLSIAPLIAGGAQERGERAGTENLAGIVGMAAALEEACRKLPERQPRIAKMREQLSQSIASSCPDICITGPSDSQRRLPSIASFACKDVDGELLVMLLDRAGVAAATGSACSTGSTDPSHVIVALGMNDPRWCHGTLRISLGDDATADEVALLCERAAACIKRARLISGCALPSK